MIKKLLLIVILIIGLSNILFADELILNKTKEQSLLLEDSVIQFNFEEYENNQNFSTGRRISAAGLNLLLGAGSYTMGDIFGGVVTTVAEGGGIALLALGISSESSGMVYAGAALLGAGIGWGIVRPLFYNPQPSKTAQLNDLRNWTVSFIPINEKEFAGKISFAAHF